MLDNPLLGLASILVLGTLAQWLAARLRLPSILLLLLTGFVVGPVAGLLDPTELLGDLLFPVVSLSVAIILFEGSLTLNLTELREVGVVVRRLISVGVVVTWIISTAGAYFILGLDLPLALLLGAILTVTGPTVVIPLLRHVRPIGRVSSALKWEGILIDPVGATLAVLVFEVVLADQAVEAYPAAIIVGILRTLLVGGITGVLGAICIYYPLRRFWIPDSLQNPVSVMMVILWFVVANTFQEEAGLLTVTVMGILLANQRSINVNKIVRFKEDLVVLLLSVVFVILAARLQLSDFSQLGINSILFVLLLILVARPLSVMASSIGSQLNWRERAFIAGLAPRGIVAAAVATVFALELAEHGVPQAETLAPIIFLVIIGTVSFYGLLASPLARWLNVAQADPQGIVFVGAHPWARQIAEALQSAGGRVLMVDSNYSNIQDARMMSLPVHFGSILADEIIDELDLNGIGRILAMTSNDEVNALAGHHFAEIFDSVDIYQLAPRTRNDGRNDFASELHGRIAFGRDLTFNRLRDLFDTGVEIRTTPLTEKYTYKTFRDENGDNAVPLFLTSKDGRIEIFTTDRPLEPLPGQTLISLVPKNQPESQLPERVAEREP